MVVYQIMQLNEKGECGLVAILTDYDEALKIKIVISETLENSKAIIQAVRVFDTAKDWSKAYTEHVLKAAPELADFPKDAA
jgi:hypothetical protein